MVLIGILWSCMAVLLCFMVFYGKIYIWLDLYRFFLVVFFLLPYAKVEMYKKLKRVVMVTVQNIQKKYITDFF